MVIVDAQGNEIEDLGAVIPQLGARLPNVPQRELPDLNQDEGEDVMLRHDLANATWRPEDENGHLYDQPAPPPLPYNQRWDRQMLAPLEGESRPRNEFDPFELTDPTRNRSEDERAFAELERERTGSDSLYTPFNTEVGTDAQGRQTLRINPSLAPNPYLEQGAKPLYSRNLDIPGFGNYDAGKNADGETNTWGRIKNAFGNGQDFAGKIGGGIGKAGDYIGGFADKILGGVNKFSSGIGQVQALANGVLGTLTTVGDIGRTLSDWWTGDDDETRAMEKANREHGYALDDAQRMREDQLWAAEANQTDMENAYGKVAWFGDSNDGTRRMVTKLDDYQQQKKDLAAEYADMLAEQGIMLGDDAEGGIRDEVRNSLLSQYEQTNGQRFKDQQRALETKLLNQGLSPDSPAYRKQMGMLIKEQEAARNEATDRANVQSYNIGSQQFGNRLNAFNAQQNLYNSYDQFVDPSKIYQSGAMHGGNVFTGNTYQTARQMMTQQQQHQAEMDSRKQQLQWQAQQNALDRQARAKDLADERNWKGEEAIRERELKWGTQLSTERMFEAKLKAEVEEALGKRVNESQWRVLFPKYISAAGSLVQGAANLYSAVTGGTVDAAMAAAHRASAYLSNTQAWAAGSQEERNRDIYNDASMDYEQQTLHNIQNEGAQPFRSADPTSTDPHPRSYAETELDRRRNRTRMNYSSDARRPQNQHGSTPFDSRNNTGHQ